jgi:hypothetical protein
VFCGVLFEARYYFISLDRYTASMGEPPRGTYYPASPGTGNQPPRHYQFNATNPWEREEREKVLKSQIIYTSLLTLNALVVLESDSSFVFVVFSVSLVLCFIMYKCSSVV